MTKTRQFLRSVSIILLQSFILQQVSFADVVVPSKADPFSKPGVSLELPETVASIEDSYLGHRSPGTGHQVTGSQSHNKTIYLLQDAHTNESAQYNLAKSLDIILKKENSELRTPSSELKYVFTEAGIGDNSLAFLRPFRPLSERTQLAKSYIKKGILHGAEYLDLTSEHNFTLWGVENPDLYIKAIQDYKAVAQERDRFDLYLKKIDATLETLKNRLMNPSLQTFSKESKLYHQDKLALTEYFQALLRESTINNIDIKKYPHLTKLKELKAKEEKLDFAKANTEHLEAVKSLPSDIQQELKDISQVKAGKILQNKKEERAYFRYLEEQVTRSQGHKVTGYPELAKYFEYLKLAKDIQAKEILGELKDLEADVFERLVKTEDERALIRSEKALRSLNKLFRFTLTPEEFKEYKDLSTTFNIEHLTGFLNKKIMDLETYYERSLFLEKGYEEMVKRSEEFYELTYARDAYFLTTALEKMDKEGQTKAALITGGFHTTNLKELLKKQNISFISITPQVLQETNIKKYESILLNQVQDLKTTQLTMKPVASTAMPAIVSTFILGGAKTNIDAIHNIGANDPAIESVIGARLAKQSNDTASAPRLGRNSPAFDTGWGSAFIGGERMTTTDARKLFGKTTNPTRRDKPIRIGSTPTDKSGRTDNKDKGARLAARDWQISHEGQLRYIFGPAEISMLQVSIETLAIALPADQANYVRRMSQNFARLDANLVEIGTIIEQNRTHLEAQVFPVNSFQREDSYHSNRMIFQGYRRQYAASKEAFTPIDRLYRATTILIHDLESLNDHRSQGIDELRSLASHPIGWDLPDAALFIDDIRAHVSPRLMHEERIKLNDGLTPEDNTVRKMATRLLQYAAQVPQTHEPAYAVRARERRVTSEDGQPSSGARLAGKSMSPVDQVTTSPEKPTENLVTGALVSGDLDDAVSSGARLAQGDLFVDLTWQSNPKEDGMPVMLSSSKAERRIEIRAPEHAISFSLVQTTNELILTDWDMKSRQTVTQRFDGLGLVEVGYYEDRELVYVLLTDEAASALGKNGRSYLALSSNKGGTFAIGNDETLRQNVSNFGYIRNVIKYRSETGRLVLGSGARLAKNETSFSYTPEVRKEIDRILDQYRYGHTDSEGAIDDLVNLGVEQEVAASMIEGVRPISEGARLSRIEALPNGLRSGDQVLTPTGLDELVAGLKSWQDKGLLSSSLRFEASQDVDEEGEVTADLQVYHDAIRDKQPLSFYWRSFDRLANYFNSLKAIDFIQVVIDHDTVSNEIDPKALKITLEDAVQAVAQNNPNIAVALLKSAMATVEDGRYPEDSDDYRGTVSSINVALDFLNGARLAEIKSLAQIKRLAGKTYTGDEAERVLIAISDFKIGQSYKNQQLDLMLKRVRFEEDRGVIEIAEARFVDVSGIVEQYLTYVDQATGLTLDIPFSELVSVTIGDASLNAVAIAGLEHQVSIDTLRSVAEDLDKIHAAHVLVDNNASETAYLLRQHISRTFASGDQARATAKLRATAGKLASREATMSHETETSVSQRSYGDIASILTQAADDIDRAGARLSIVSKEIASASKLITSFLSVQGIGTLPRQNATRINELLVEITRKLTGFGSKPVNYDDITSLIAQLDDVNLAVYSADLGVTLHGGSKKMLAAIQTHIANAKKALHTDNISTLFGARLSTYVVDKNEMARILRNNLYHNESFRYISGAINYLDALNGPYDGPYVDLYKMAKDESIASGSAEQNAALFLFVKLLLLQRTRDLYGSILRSTKADKTLDLSHEFVSQVERIWERLSSVGIFSADQANLALLQKYENSMKKDPKIRNNTGFLAALDDIHTQIALLEQIADQDRFAREQAHKAAVRSNLANRLYADGMDQAIRLPDEQTLPSYRTAPFIWNTLKMHSARFREIEQKAWSLLGHPVSGLKGGLLVRTEPGEHDLWLVPYSFAKGMEYLAIIDMTDGRILPVSGDHVSSGRIGFSESLGAVAKLKKDVLVIEDANAVLTLKVSDDGITEESYKAKNSGDAAGARLAGANMSPVGQVTTSPEKPAKNLVTGALVSAGDLDDVASSGARLAQELPDLEQYLGGEKVARYLLRVQQAGSKPQFTQIEADILDDLKQVILDKLGITTPLAQVVDVQVPAIKSKWWHINISWSTIQSIGGAKTALRIIDQQLSETKEALNKELGQGARLSQYALAVTTKTFSDIGLQNVTISIIGEKGTTDIYVQTPLNWQKEQIVAEVNRIVRENSTMPIVLLQDLIKERFRSIVSDYQSTNEIHRKTSSPMDEFKVSKALVTDPTLTFQVVINKPYALNSYAQSVKTNIFIHFDGAGGVTEFTVVYPERLTAKELWDAISNDLDKAMRGASDARQEEKVILEFLSKQQNTGARLALGEVSREMVEDLVRMKQAKPDVPLLAAFFGEAGSGKGTVAESHAIQVNRILDEMGRHDLGRVETLSTGDEFSANPDPVISEIMARGELVPDGAVKTAVEGVLVRPKYKNAFMIIVDGFPRTENQLKMIDDGELQINNKPLSLDFQLSLDMQNVDPAQILADTIYRAEELLKQDPPRKRRDARYTTVNGVEVVDKAQTEVVFNKRREVYTKETLPVVKAVEQRPTTVKIPARIAGGKDRDESKALVLDAFLTGLAPILAKGARLSVYQDLLDKPFLKSRRDRLEGYLGIARRKAIEKLSDLEHALALLDEEFTGAIQDEISSLLRNNGVPKSFYEGESFRVEATPGSSPARINIDIDGVHLDEYGKRIDPEKRADAYALAGLYDALAKSIERVKVQMEREISQVQTRLQEVTRIYREKVFPALETSSETVSLIGQFGRDTRDIVLLKDLERMIEVFDEKVAVILREQVKVAMKPLDDTPKLALRNILAPVSPIFKDHSATIVVSHTDSVIEKFDSYQLATILQAVKSALATERIRLIGPDGARLASAVFVAKYAGVDDVPGMVEVQALSAPGKRKITLFKVKDFGFAPLTTFVISLRKGVTDQSAANQIAHELEKRSKNEDLNNENASIWTSQINWMANFAAPVRSTAEEDIFGARLARSTSTTQTVGRQDLAVRTDTPFSFTAQIKQAVVGIAYAQEPFIQANPGSELTIQVSARQLLRLGFTLNRAGKGKFVAVRAQLDGNAVTERFDLVEAKKSGDTITAKVTSANAEMLLRVREGSIQNDLSLAKIDTSVNVLAQLHLSFIRDLDPEIYDIVLLSVAKRTKENISLKQGQFLSYLAGAPEQLAFAKSRLDLLDQENPALNIRSAFSDKSKLPGFKTVAVALASQVVKDADYQIPAEELTAGSVGIPDMRVVEATPRVGIQKGQTLDTYYLSAVRTATNNPDLKPGTWTDIALGVASVAQRTLNTLKPLLQLINTEYRQWAAGRIATLSAA